MKIDPRLHRPLEPDPNEELRKAEMAVPQFERAELYFVPAINLELANRVFGRALQLLRGHLVEVRERLRKPHPAPVSAAIATAPGRPISVRGY